MRLFSSDSLLSKTLSLIGDIVTLHFIWLFCSLPVFTIGASTTALYYAMMKRIRTEEGYVAKNFMRSFKENFRQGTILWLLLVCLGILFATDFQISRSIGGAAGKCMTAACAVFLVPYILTCLYIFPILAKFENSIFRNVKNALIMGFKHFFLSLFLLIICATFSLLALIFPPFIGLLICCGAGLHCYISSNIFIYIFRQYLPKEADSDIEKSGKRLE